MPRWSKKQKRIHITHWTQVKLIKTVAVRCMWLGPCRRTKSTKTWLKVDPKAPTKHKTPHQNSINSSLRSLIKVATQLTTPKKNRSWKRKSTVMPPTAKSCCWESCPNSRRWTSSRRCTRTLCRRQRRSRSVLKLIMEQVKKRSSTRYQSAEVLRNCSDRLTCH